MDMRSTILAAMFVSIANHTNVFGSMSVRFAPGLYKGISPHDEMNLSKGLVIINPAVGGWSEGEGGQNSLKTYFRGDEKIVHSFLGGLNNSL